jgi:hypothetical protein
MRDVGRPPCRTNVLGEYRSSADAAPTNLATFAAVMTTKATANQPKAR